MYGKKFVLILLFCITSYFTIFIYQDLFAFFGITILVLLINRFIEIYYENKKRKEEKELLKNIKEINDKMK